MSKTSWQLGRSGLWADPIAWSAGTPPSNSASVLIAAAPVIAGLPYTITLQGSAAVHAISQMQAGATLDVSAGTLSVYGKYALTAGTLVLDNAALQGGTLASTTGTVLIGHPATLSGVAVDGTLAIQGLSAGASYAEVSLLGDRFAGAAGIGAGALLLGPKISAELGTSPTLDAVGVTLNGASLQQMGGTLTLGTRSAISATGNATLGDTNALSSQGQISVSGSNSLLAIEATTFLNQGTLSVSGGAASLVQAASFDNTGLVSVGSGSYLRIEATGAALANAGSIAVSGGTLSLDAALTTAQLGAFPIASGTLAIGGTLDNSGATLRTGSNLANLLLEGGTITGGTVVNSGNFSIGNPPASILNPIFAPDSVLSGVIFDGMLNISGDYAKLDVANGLTANNVSGTGAGTIDIDGQGADLTFLGNQTIDNVQINLGDAAPLDYQTEGLLWNGNNTLTLGAHVTVTQTGISTRIERLGYSGAIANLGTIAAAVSGGSLSLNGLANAGRIAVSNSDTVWLSNASNAGTVSDSGGLMVLNTVTNRGLIAVSGPPGPSCLTESLVSSGLANSGVLSISNGATANLGDSWTNTGIFAVSGGELSVGGSFTTAQLGTVRIGAGGTLGLTGTLVNAGTLSIGAGSGLPAVALQPYGAIQGGTIVDAGGGLLARGGTLSGATYRGTLSIDRPFATLTVTDGLILADLTGTRPGSLSLTGAGDRLAWDSTQALDNAVVSIGGASAGYGAPAIAAGPGDTQPVLLGAHLRVQQSGAYAAIGTSTGSYTSAATLAANVAHGQFTLGGSAFTNTGTIGIARGDTVSASAAGFTNAGLIVVGVGSALDLDLTNYFASASLAGQSFTNTGSITMAGGTLVEQTGNGLFPDVPLLNASGGHIGGAGVIASQIDNDGLVEARGGSLNLVQAVSGIGTLQVDQGATLVLGGVGHGQTARFAGTGGVLGLQPAYFLGTIGGFAAGDTIDLFNIAARSAAFAGDTLAVSLANGSTLRLGTTSALTGPLSVAAGTHGDMLIRFAPAGAVSHALPVRAFVTIPETETQTAQLADPHGAAIEGPGWTHMMHSY